MKLTRTFCLGLLLAFATVSAHAADRVVGTWVLDVAKSTFDGAPPKSGMRVYEETPAGMHMTARTVAADGKEHVQEVTFKADGKDYPFKGSADWDALSASAKDANTLEFVQKKGGKVVGHGSRTISADGKSLTVSGSGTKADGSKMQSVLVFTRK